MLKFEVNITKALKKLEDIRDELLLYIDIQTAKKLEEYKQDLVSFVEEQKGKWEPLTEKYAKYKREKGLDPRILISTGKYLASIKVKKIGPMKYSIVPEGNEELGQWLEFGTGRMPGRAHWSYIDTRTRYTLNNILTQLAKKEAQRLSKK